MNQKHTPGPWSIVSYLDEHDRRGKNALVTHNTQGARHRVHSANHCVTYTVPTLGDARLIAAAPDLLEAAEIVLQVAQHATIAFDRWTFDGRLVSGILERAIAKAKGGTE